MDITPLIESGTHIITGYGKGSFTIGEDKISNSILLFPHRLVELKERDINAIDASTIISHIKAYQGIELLLIGSGQQHLPAPVELSHTLPEHDIRFDIMNTGAACRTYNVLLAEGRDIGALLIAN